MNGIDGLLSDPLLAMGIGLLGNNQGLTKGAAFGNAMQGGLLSAQNAQQMQAMSMLRQAQAQKLRREQEQQAAIDEAIAKLPPDQQQMARLDPSAFVKSQMPGELPDKVQQYKFAQGQGYRGSFTDFLTETGRASATNVNVGAPVITFPWQAQTGPGRELQDRAQVAANYGPNSQEVAQFDARIEAERTKPLPKDAQDKITGSIGMMDAVKTLEDNIDAFGLAQGPATKGAAALGISDKAVRVAEATRKLETDIQSIIQGIPSNYDAKLFIGRIPRLMGGPGGLGDSKATAEEKTRLLKEESQRVIKATVSYYKGIGGYAVPPEISAMAKKYGIDIEAIPAWKGTPGVDDPLLGVPLNQRSKVPTPRPAPMVPPGTRVPTPAAPAAGPLRLPPGVTVERID